jgi:hypothetical protein
MQNSKIFQIYYSQDTYRGLDPGFLPLNNINGPAEWMEYWPIRKYFLENEVDRNTLIGFLSPRFYEKTGLTSKDVYDHIDANPDNDIYLFNPYFHLAAWHPNVFAQAEYSHPGLDSALVEVLKLLDINISPQNLIMSSLETVYCNYFVARIDFWKKWLMLCEFIFQISEIKNNSTGEKLRSNTTYVRGKMPLQIFLIERIASLLLATVKTWKCIPSYTYLNMGFSAKKRIENIFSELHELDALKIAFTTTKNNIYLESYINKKKCLINDYGLFI